MLKEQTISRRRLAIYIITCAAVLIAVAVYMAAPRGISSLQVYAEDGGRIDAELKVYVDTDTHIRCKVEPAAFARRSVKYRSSDEEIATVDKKGVLHAFKEGEVRITAECAGVKRYFTVKVNQSVADISGIKEKLTIIVGEQIQLEPKLIMADPGLEEPIVSFMTKKPSVVRVDDNGLVTGIGEGVTTIEIRAGTFKKSIEVTVIKIPAAVYYSGYTKETDTGDKRKTAQPENRNRNNKKKDKNKSDSNTGDKGNDGSDNNDGTDNSGENVDQGDTDNTDTDNIDDSSSVDGSDNDPDGGENGTDSSGDGSGNVPDSGENGTDNSDDGSSNAPVNSDDPGTGNTDSGNSENSGSNSGGIEETNIQS